MIDKIKEKLFQKKEPKFLYEVIGQENGVYELVKNFYDVMENDPKAKECLATHVVVDGKIPDIIKKKLFMFLCGWFGGPNLYVETYGNPKMRARHIHVKITETERDQWLYCMWEAFKKHPIDISKDDFYRFEGSFKALAGRIQNA